MPVRDTLTPQLLSFRRSLPGYMRRRADETGDDVKDRVQRRTPIGREIDRRTGRDMGPTADLRRSVTKIRVQKPAPNVWRSGAYSIRSYVAHVEYGTRRHIIRPRTGRVGRHGKAATLRFWTNGQLVYARMVNHPGAPGHFMFRLGLEEAQAAFVLRENRALQAHMRRYFR